MKTAGPDFKQSFSEIIATPSVSSVDPALDQGNGAVVDSLANWFNDLGFRVEKLPVSGSEGKYNLVATLGEGPDGLVLAGHTDTVPFNEEQWQQDPFTLVEKNDRYYGLGTADMKCFFPVVIDALQEMDVRKFEKPLYVIATADEESSMSGARALFDSGARLGRYALIGEPTGLVPVRMHKGVLMESITLIGQSGHSSNPALGNSALEGMHRVISRLLQWRSELQGTYRNDNFEVPVPTLNFGSIRGGDNPNRICASCVMTMDMRLLPGMVIEDIRGRLYAEIHQSVADSGLELHIHSLFGGVPPFETNSESEIVRIAEKFSGQSAGSVTFGTEGPYYNRMGMETIILGPGNIAQAHQANEYIEMKRIEPMKKILRTLIGHFCNGSQ